MYISTNAIILGAGYGTRLRPLTEHLPKPLLPICNRPLLANILFNLQAAGVERIAVNTHHLGETIADFIAGSEFKDAVEIFPEPEILGTGGPLVNARKLLVSGKDFILHNGDILTDLDFRALLEHHRNCKAMVTMVLIDGPENKVRVDAAGNIIDILDKLGTPAAAGDKFTYTGLTAFTPEIFDFLPELPVNCSVITAILEVIKNCPGRVAAYRPEAVYWNDLGSPKQYYQAHEDILLHRKLRLPGLDIQSPVIVGENCEIAPDAELAGFVAVGDNCRVGNGTSLQNCIMLSGSSVGGNEFRRHELIAPNCSVHCDAGELAGLKIIDDIAKYRISSLMEHGSDRRFYRLKSPETTQVLMVSNAADSDFSRFITVGGFLQSLNLMTPKIYDTCPEEFAVLMEDLGNDTLYRLLEHHPETGLEALYRRVLDALVEFQFTGAAALAERDPESVGIRIFDYDYFRWETSYFRERFLEKYRGMPASETVVLDEEFHRLATVASGIPKLLIHRDFQSQNILLHNGRIRFVDFQGARLGPVGLDAVSLLYDPYVKISAPVRARLVDYYFEKFTAAAPGDFRFSRARFDEYLLTCALQRLMQALGAYGFLGMVKKKQHYLEFIPNGLANLLEVIAGTSAYPRLSGILAIFN